MMGIENNNKISLRPCMLFCGEVLGCSMVRVALSFFVTVGCSFRVMNTAPAAPSLTDTCCSFPHRITDAKFTLAFQSGTPEEGWYGAVV